MFTGIIQAMGRLRESRQMGEDRRLRIDTDGLDMTAVRIGDSIAVNGCCLTAIEVDEQGFAADVSIESLTRTTLGRLSPGDTLNLEPALTLATPLGGHLVSGHVDGVGEVVLREPAGRSEHWRFRAPSEIAHYIAAKGSIAIEGISLTVNAVEAATFDVNIVPHTAAVTTFGDYQAGQPVNLEVDLVARYLERLLQGSEIAGQGGVSEALLKRSGFMGER
ncbi:riboflavin synthase [Spiribacter salinus]|uniref:riboflavin synthase n=1 Tax=Spiribacter salinus TaxID=1335746 RepID=UPI001C9503AF|nr:riboflavin synthase [Spiribacter salinus]MBY5267798.1 riboflavin synthase subunit alpha [Spiribacter salinus]